MIKTKKQSLFNFGQAYSSTMIEYGERLAAALKVSNITVSELATGMGVSYQAVKRVIDGMSKAFSAANNAKAAAFLKINPDWLATGQGSMRAVTPLPGPTLEQALKLIAQQLNLLPGEQRLEIARHLDTLARAPDSAKALDALLQSFKEPGQPTLSPTVEKALKPGLAVESADFFQVERPKA